MVEPLRPQMYQQALEFQRPMESHQTGEVSFDKGISLCSCRQCYLKQQEVFPCPKEDYKQ